MYTNNTQQVHVGDLGVFIAACRDVAMFRHPTYNNIWRILSVVYTQTSIMRQYVSLCQSLCT